MADAPLELHEHSRHAECAAWLARRRPAGTFWLALDDVAEEFAPGCANLLLLDGAVGLTPATAQALRQRLTGGRMHVLADLIAQCDPSVVPPAELELWDRAPPVGDEEVPEADKPPRTGWAEAAQTIAKDGGDKLVIGEFGNEDDAQPDSEATEPPREPGGS